MPKKKKKNTVSSPSDIISDFISGMNEGKKDKEVDVQLLSESSLNESIKGVLSTQSATLDYAIGRGGIPLSRITIFHGKESAGKTSLALHLVAEAQKRGGIGVYIDKERKLDPEYAIKLGVDPDRMILPKPKTVKTLEGVVKYIRDTIKMAKRLREKYEKPVPIVMIVDSLNACKAFETLETPTGKKRYPAEARIWSEELPEIVEDLSTEHVALVFVSQVRKKMNVMFGNDEELAGGNAPRFYASLIIYIRKIGTEKDSNGEKTGSKIEIECRKNQIGPPFKKAQFTIYWNKGIDYQHSLILQLASMGIIKKMPKTKTRKAGYVIGEKTVLGKTVIGAAETLRSKPKLEEKLINLFYKKMGWSGRNEHNRKENKK